LYNISYEATDSKGQGSCGTLSVVEKMVSLSGNAAPEESSMTQSYITGHYSFILLQYVYGIIVTIYNSWLIETFSGKIMAYIIHAVLKCNACVAMFLGPSPPCLHTASD